MKSGLSAIPISPMPNLKDYTLQRSAFDWQREKGLLDVSAGNEGFNFNIAYQAVERHAKGTLKKTIAIRWVKKDKSAVDFTYGDLNKLSSRFANVLNTLGIKKGESVFTLTARIPELYIAALGTLKATSVFCPLFSAFGPEPIFQRLSRGNAKVLITTKELYNKKVKQLVDRLPALDYILIADELAAIDGERGNVLSLPALMEEANEVFSIPATNQEDPVLLHFTSGTTGMPKGALHVHNAALMHYITGKYVLDFHDGDIFWCTADPGWVTGTSYGILAPLINGVTNIVDSEEFDAVRWYSILEEQRVNVWYTAPTAIRRLMRLDINPREKYDLKHLRLICSVGEPLAADAVLWGERSFGMPILDNWWQTETGGIMIANYRSMKVKPGSMGKPLPGIEAEIAEITDNAINIISTPGQQGQLVLKKGWPSMFRAYLNDDERYQKCFKGDWYISGDLAKKDSDGYFWFVGRADDIIKTSGHMVGPFEVESTLMQHEAVAEAAVIGIPDPIIGELVRAFVVLKKGYKPDENLKLDIMGFARKKLGAAVAPKEISFAGSLPKTKSGKILRRLLKARELGLPEGDLSTLEKED